MTSRINRSWKKAAALLTVAVAVLGVSSPASALSSAPANPLDLADPSVLVDGGRYYVYATGNNSNLQVTSSTDMQTWTPVTDPLPQLPRWASPPSTWAPAVAKRGSTYVMYYTAHHASWNVQCLSIATSNRPNGPFADTSNKPFLCQRNLGGSIDPQPFAAPDGSLYLIWKSDNNAIGRPTQLWSQKLSPDGQSLTGSAVKLLDNNAAWQGTNMEGPAMHFASGTYYLFYGANDWFSANAGIGYATCSGPSGPCVNRSVSQAWLGSRPGAQGPSGPAVFTDLAGATRLAYHSWGSGPVGYPGGARSLWIDPLSFSGGSPVLS